jgi:RNA polymerase sigma-70 factor (ECF subfamily)
LPGGKGGPEPTAAPAEIAAPREDIAERMHGVAEAGPAVQLASHEQLGALFDRLDQLSAQQRTALVLRYGHDLAVGDIATMLGVEPATAKTHLVRGLARLRDLMEEHR